MTKRLVLTPNSHHLQHLDPSPIPPSLNTSAYAPRYSSTLANCPHLSGYLSLTLLLCLSSPSLQTKSLRGPSLISNVSKTLDFTSPAAVTYTTVILYTHLPPTCTTFPVQSMPGSMSSICSGALPPLVRRVYTFSGSSTMTFAPCHTLSGSCMNMCPSGRRSQRLHSLSLLLSCRVTRGRWSSRSVNETARCLRPGRCSTRDGTLRSLSCSQAMPSVPRSWWGRP